MNCYRVYLVACVIFGGTFDYSKKLERFEELELELADPALWSDPSRAKTLNQEKSQLEKCLQPLKILPEQIRDFRDLLDLALDEANVDLVDELETEVSRLEKIVSKLEFQRMFHQVVDFNDAFLDIQAGSGGTEAQDWAEILLRMYLRWAEQQGFSCEIMAVSSGDVAGIKSVTLAIKGDCAYGWLRTEIGVHRLVRKSPFDSGNRRHTSFAAVFISPDIDDSIEIDINPSDLRIDTYRASGAGGQHVNRTDSAVRITHLPTSVIVQCQSDRSQHKNKAHAMKQLRAKLYERALKEKQTEQTRLESEKSDIAWGAQIRSYVLDQSRIKDLRTGLEICNTQAVLDGGLMPFIEASLKQGL